MQPEVSLAYSASSLVGSLAEYDILRPAAAAVPRGVQRRSPVKIVFSVRLHILVEYLNFLLVMHIKTHQYSAAKPAAGLEEIPLQLKLAIFSDGRMKKMLKMYKLTE